VRPDFGDGLIRQSEHRNSGAAEMLYAERYSRSVSLLAGMEVQREVPRGLDLDRADAAGVFQPVTANNLTMNFYSPYAAVDGTLLRFLHYKQATARTPPRSTIRTSTAPRFRSPAGRLRGHRKGRSHFFRPRGARICPRYR
jgi:hypothetical protein